MKMGESTYFSLPPPPTTGLQLSGCCHLVETTTRSATVAAGSCGNTRSFLAIRSRPTKALQRALTASGRKCGAHGPGGSRRPSSRPVSPPAGLPMSPISRPERLPARLHELIPGSAGLSLSPFALGPFSSRQRHPLSRFGGQNPHCLDKCRDLTSSGDRLGRVASMLERISVTLRRAW